MALLQLQPPSAFSISADPHTVSKRWTEWATTLKRFLAASGISDDAQKQEILLYTAGKEVADIFKEISQTRPATDQPEQQTLDSLIAALTQHFQKRDNVVFTRYQFRQCTQLDGEGIDSWHNRLCNAAEACQFGELRQSLIRDQIVACCRSESLRKRLLNVPNISLPDALQLARTNEAASQQAAIMERSAAGPAEEVHAASDKRPTRRPPASPADKCLRCGEPGHRTCNRAQGKRCSNCGKLHHLAKACLSGRARINMAEPEPEEPAVAHLAEAVFSSLDPSRTSTTFKAVINGANVPVLIDSGASCNVLSQRTLRLTGAPERALQPTHTRVYPLGAARPLTPAGQITLHTKINGNSERVRVIVIREDCITILGRETSTQMGMLRVGPQAETALTAGLTPTVNDLHLPQDLRLSSIRKEFSDRFQGIGCIKGVSVSIQLKEEAVPVCHPPSRVPVHLRTTVEKELKGQLAAGILERVTGPSAWSSRMVVVPKASPGEIRITQDLRDVNKYVIPEKQPIPTFEEVTDEMAGSTYFSELDVAKAFHQIEVSEESRQLLTFSTPLGLLRLKRLCMGFTSASEILQRVMTSILSGLRGVRWVHDDIIIFASTIKEHNERLRNCLVRLRQHNVTLNPRKCRIATQQADFLAMRLSAAGIQPTEEKLEAVANFKRPENATEVRSFLGLVTFVARFIPNLADKARPLRELTKKNVKWSWGPQQASAFQTIKQSIAHSTTLAFFNKNCETRLIVDASPTGLGAILAQVQPGGLTRPIAYASRSLSDTEQRYSQTEREALAVKFGCLKFHHYLSGCPKFKVITDHKPLVSLLSPGSRPPPRIERMALRLQDLHFEVTYQPGADNPADVLSRQPRPTPPNNQGEDLDTAYIAMTAQAAAPNSISLETIKVAAAGDKAIQAAVSGLRSRRWQLDSHDTRSLHGLRHELSQHDGLLLKGHQIVVPAILRYRCLQLAHQGHLGVQKTLARLQTKVWWPSMRASVENFVNSCLSCKACTNTAELKAAPLQPTELPQGPWLELGLDFLGPIRGHMLLVCTDYFSRFPLVQTMSGSTAAAPVIRTLRQWFSTFGQPVKITTDNGPPFSSAEFNAFLRSQGVHHHRTTPLHPQANGLVERCNRGLNKAIRAAILEGSDWQAALDDYLAAYRRTPHAATGMAPADLLFGRQLNDTIPSLRHSRPVDARRQTVRGHDSRAKERMKAFADSKRGATDHQITVGDLVLRRLTNRSKTDPFFEASPWTVTEIRGNTLQLQRAGQRCSRHASHVKRVSQAADEWPGDPGERDSGQDSRPDEPTGPPEPTGNQDVPLANRPHPRQAKETPKRYEEGDRRKALDI
ncbi:hypothetical protein BOX15_Mlig032170g1 [Macrostomum lignano]|uniref:Reverse transcriptase n=1 Tax=Macrostomum lignano TaxID=282301 RepID=A0A267F585_9PLAT|nr:hypothetical protein BOX15_Mlig032170g1 [Macrostomum lignano]